jgi:hypothetical protein
MPLGEGAIKKVTCQHEAESHKIQKVFWRAPRWAANYCAEQQKNESTKDSRFLL